MRIGNLVFRSALLFSLATTSAFAATHNIQVGQAGSTTFTPSSITIPAGDTITFINSNAGGLLHNAVSDDGGATFSSGAAAAGPWMFTTPPLTTPIAFHCTVHGTAGPGGGVPGTGMAGSIAIQATPVKLQSFEVH
jgi:plastocyanin